MQEEHSVSGWVYNGLLEFKVGVIVLTIKKKKNILTVSAF